MTDKERIDRLEKAMERLCTVIKTYMYASDPRWHTELELIKQWVRGDLEPIRPQPMNIDPSRWQEEGDERV